VCIFPQYAQSAHAYAQSTKVRACKIVPLQTNYNCRTMITRDYYALMGGTDPDKASGGSANEQVVDTDPDKASGGSANEQVVDTNAAASAPAARKIPGGVWKTWKDYYSNSAGLQNLGGGTPMPIQSYRDKVFSDYQYNHKNAYGKHDPITIKYRLPAYFNGEDLTNHVNRFTQRIWNPETNQYEYKHGYYDQTEIDEPKEVFLEDGEDNWKYFDGAQKWVQTHGSGAVLGPANIWYYYDNDKRFDENGKPIKQTASPAVTGGTQGKTSMAEPSKSKLDDVVNRRLAYNGLA